jgi:SAM-dependent methyltransferase
MSFPHDDKAWVSAADFLRGRLKPADRLVAPDLFRWVIPRAQRFLAARNASPADFAWIVVHKGELAGIPRSFLDSLPRAALPVFANDVFVIWATSADNTLKDLSESAHVRAFFVNLDALPAAAVPRVGAVRVPTPEPARALRPPPPPEARDAPVRPWLAPGGIGGVPGAARERAFQQELDRLAEDYLAGGRGRRVLDIGCGSGRLAEALPHAEAVTGIDIDPAALMRAQTRHLGQPHFAFARMDATRMAFADSSFDCAVILDGADALADLPGALAEAARVLAPGGLLLVTAPNRDSLPLRALRRLALPVPGRAFRVSELTGMLRAAGLAVIRSDGLFLSPGWALPGTGGALGPLEEDPEFIEAARLLGRRVGPDYALAFALLARKG